MGCGFHPGPAEGGEFLEQAPSAFGILGLSEKTLQFVDAEDAEAQAVKRIGDAKSQVGRKLHNVVKSLPECPLRAIMLLK